MANNLKERVASKFPAITSVRELSVYTKNAAKGADNAYVKVSQLKAEIDAIAKEIARLRTPQGADARTTKELSDKRAELRKQRDAKERIYAVELERGKSLEAVADEYEYVFSKVTGEKTSFRKKARFEEANVNVNSKDIKDLITAIKAEPVAAVNATVKKTTTSKKDAKKALVKKEVKKEAPKKEVKKVEVVKAEPAKKEEAPKKKSNGVWTVLILIVAAAVCYFGLR